MAANIADTYEPCLVDKDNFPFRTACFSAYGHSIEWKTFTWYLHSKLSQEQVTKYLELFNFPEISDIVTYAGVPTMKEVSEYFNGGENRAWYKFVVKEEKFNATLFLIWATIARQVQEHPDQVKDFLDFLTKYQHSPIQTYFLAMRFRVDESRDTARGTNHELSSAGVNQFYIKNWKNLDKAFHTKLLKLKEEGRSFGYRVHKTIEPLMNINKSREDWRFHVEVITDERYSTFLNGAY